ncbi:MAG TPA: LUD domain-containing protein [Rhizomicrobium sp.]|nr:LUD domain-containing protein [Rhizomicrobium sp.]
MSGREAILSAIRAQRVKTAPRPSSYRAPAFEDDAVTHFVAQATRSAAEVRRLGRLSDVPAAIAEALRARNMKAAVHLPPNSPLLALLPWDSAPGLGREFAPPGPDEAAVTLAPYAIAETGTIAYAARGDAPASWHFRPGLEIAVVRKAAIVADFETVLARVKNDGQWPSTLNLVTGPSRTGDIEQTLELGAHGPKAVVVLVVEE